MSNAFNQNHILGILIMAEGILNSLDIRGNVALEVCLQAGLCALAAICLGKVCGKNQYDIGISDRTTQKIRSDV